MSILILSDEEVKKKNINLPWLAIEAADELERLRLKKNTDLKNTKELSRIIKEDFNKRWDYISLFRKAYNLAYQENLPNSLKEIPKEYLNGVSNCLANPKGLERELELKMLVNFCVNLSDCSSLHEQYLESLKGPCF